MLSTPLAARTLALAASLAAAGCQADTTGTGLEEGDTGEDADEDTDSDGSGDGSDQSDDLFDPHRVIQVEIDLSEEDWDTIRTQNRTVLDIFSPGCLEEPFASPFTYVAGTVTVDGTTLDTVGIRKKGFLGSLDDERPSLKLKFDEYVQGQLLSGLERMTLNNNKQDPSALHQCLGYAVFAAAGIPAPRCNFAHVVVNGLDLGIYSHVESVKKRFLRRHFDDDEGQLYEGTLSDFLSGWTGTFEQKTNRDRPYDRSDIESLVTALEQPDAELIDALDPAVDVDEFLSFWATEVLVGHWDGYASNSNNYFVYADPGSGRFTFIPWGIDDILSDGEETPEHRSFFATAELPRRLYQHPEGRARYAQRMRELIDGVWDEVSLLAEVERMESMLDPFVGTSNDAGVAAVREFIGAQADRILAELDAGPPIWEGGPREEICFTELGTLSAGFETSFGTLGVEDPFASGTGTLDIDVDAGSFVPVSVGSGAGFSPDDPESSGPIVQIVGALPDDTVLVVYAEVSPARFVSGASIEIDWSDAFVAVITYDPSSDRDEMLGVLAGGTLGLEVGTMDDGAEVRGTIHGPLVDFPF